MARAVVISWGPVMTTSKSLQPGRARPVGCRFHTGNIDRGQCTASQWGYAMSSHITMD
jgi:hypothetical protein